MKSENYPPPPSLRSLPSVAMGIATLRGYRMTSSHSSKDPLRPPVSGGQSVWCGHKSVVTDSSPCRGIEGVRSPPETGGSTPAGGRGWINSLRSPVVTKFATPSAQAWNTTGKEIKTLRPLRPLRENINHPVIVSSHTKDTNTEAPSGYFAPFSTAFICS